MELVRCVQSYIDFSVDDLHQHAGGRGRKVKVYAFRLQIVRKMHDFTRIPRIAVKPIASAVHPVEPVRNAIVDSAANLYDIPAAIILIGKVVLCKESFKSPLTVFSDIIAIIS